MIHCTRCGLPETYETIEFDAAGVCNICRNADVRRDVIDWQQRAYDLDAIVYDYQGKHPYDCIVPFSGGKDSTYTLWYLVRTLGLKPLVVQFDHGFMRDGVKANNERTFKALGVDVLAFRPNWHLVKRVMLEALIRRGDFCWHCHTGIFAYPMQVALKEKVPLIIWGEPSSDYTAYYGPGETEEVDEARFNKFTNLGIAAEDMAGMIKQDSSFDFRDLAPFVYPPRKDLAALGVRSICLGSYIPWDPVKQAELMREELGWEGAEVDGLAPRYWYEKIECGVQGVRDYIKHLKRGYGRTRQMTALDVRNGRMDLDKANGLSRLYDGVRPPILDEWLGWLGISETEFRAIVHQTVVPPHVMPA